jgi:hypothetical protein
MPQHWPVLARMSKAVSERLPCLRACLRRIVRSKRWPRRILVACLTRRPMPGVGGRCLRGSDKSNLGSSPFYRPGVLSCALPLSIPMGEESLVGGDSTRGPPPY